MIQGNTVFVLGAGASMACGFPSGEKLYREVVAALEFRGGTIPPMVHHLRSAGFTDDDARRLRTGLVETSCGFSIDSFLQLPIARELVSIAKAAMAINLIPRESEDCDIPKALGEEDWYEYALSRILPVDVESDFAETRLKVITLNFDRSFEARVERIVRARAQRPDRVKQVATRLVPVIHLHGTLPGEFPAAPRFHNEDLRASTLQESTTSLKIVAEGPSSSDLDAAREAIRWAGEICFIGCSFHQFTLDRLIPSTGLRDKAVYGTTYEMDPGRIGKVRSRFEGSGVVKEQIRLESETALAFFKNTGVVHHD